MESSIKSLQDEKAKLELYQKELSKKQFMTKVKIKAIEKSIKLLTEAETAQKP